MLARWTWSLWQAGSDEPHAPAVFSVDGLSLAVYSDVLVSRGPVGKLDGKILGCRELVVLHDAQAHPLLATTHRGDQHLTLGLPQMLCCYEQATGQAQVKRVVVDREGMAAELLAQLHQEGRQVVTLLRADQYEGEESFEQGGAWQPWRSNRAGQVICEVASARFTLPRPNPLDSPVQVEVAPFRYRFFGEREKKREDFAIRRQVRGSWQRSLEHFFQWCYTLFWNCQGYVLCLSGRSRTARAHVVGLSCVLMRHHARKRTVYGTASSKE